MPILEDIMDHQVLGREFKRGLHEGELKGELTIIRPNREAFRRPPGLGGGTVVWPDRG